MGALIDLINKLIGLIKSLLSKKCECLDPEQYDQLVAELDDIIRKLEDWIAKAGAGTIGGQSK